MVTHYCPLLIVHCHAMHQSSRSRMASTVQLTYRCSKACSWRDVNFCKHEECSLPIKPALSFTAVAFRDISSTAAALIKQLLPIEIHVPVCELQATHRPTIAGVTPTDELRHSSIAATWCMEQQRCTGRRAPRCSSWFLKTAFKIT